MTQILNRYDEAVALIRDAKRVNTSALQRQLGVSYDDASILVLAMEAKGVISAPTATGARKVLKKKEKVDGAS